MGIKTVAKKILKTFGLFDKVKNIRDDIIQKKKLTKKYVFEDRSKGYEKVCIILAGYKPFLYNIIFKRIKKFIPNDIDICICSSGLYSEELSKIAKSNNWSYLSTKRNNVSLVQNVAITLFDKANYIYKLDEDIFITKGLFETLLKTYEKCKNDNVYKPGFVAPVIPINGFGCRYVLNRFDLVDVYKEKFEIPLQYEVRKTMVGTNSDVAKFFWREGRYVPSIDKMNEELQKDDFKYEVCPIRFNIGAIMFTREFWNEMKMFKVSSGSGMGEDETQICEFCIISSMPIIIAENSLVGHLSFGPQNSEMQEYFEENNEIFDINIGEK